MKNRQTLRRILAFILSLALVMSDISLMPMTPIVLAANPEDPDTDDPTTFKDAAVNNTGSDGAEDIDFETLAESIIFDDISFSSQTYSATAYGNISLYADYDYMSLRNSLSKIQLILIYKEDPDGKYLSISDNQISMERIDGEGWNTANISSKIKGLYYGSSSYFKCNMDGEKTGSGLGKGLKPDTTYTCYACIRENGGSDCYIKSIGKTFTTDNKIITESQINAWDFSTDIGFFENRVNFLLNNHANERIAGFYLGNVPEIAKDEEVSTLINALDIYDELSSNSSSYREIETEDETYYYEYHLLFSESVEDADLYAIVYTGSGAGDHLTFVKLNDGKISVQLIDPKQDDYKVTLKETPGSITIDASVSGNGWDSSKLRCRAYIKETDKGAETYQHYKENVVYKDDEITRAIWDQKDGNLNAQITFSAGHRLYNDDDVYLVLDRNKNYDIRVLIGRFNSEQNEEEVSSATLFSKEQENMAFGEDVWISRSEFDEGLFGHIKVELDYVSGSEESGEGRLYTEDGVYQSALNLISGIPSEENSFNQDISSLKGIRYLKNISQICISGTELSDIDEITSLTGLRSIDLYNNHITKLPDLSGMQHLTSLNLSWNWIPESEITKDKLPESLRFYDEDDDYSSLEDFISSTIRNQYSVDALNDYTDNYKLNSVSADHPFELHVENSALPGLKYKSGYSYYLLQAGEDYENEYRIGSDSSYYYSEDIVFMIRFSLSINEVVGNGSNYDFKINKLAGVYGFGSKAIPYRIYRINVKVVNEWDHYNIELKERSRNLIYSNVANVDYEDINDKDAKIKTAPSARQLIYNAEPQKLVSENGVAVGGEFRYALSTNGVTPPTDGFDAAIPTATDAGIYHVWYMVEADEDHISTTPICIDTTITPASYVIFYDKNDGSQTVVSQNKTIGKAGENATISINSISRTGYMLTGWNDKQDGSGKSYKNGDEYIPVQKDDKSFADLTIYAQWEAISLNFISINKAPDKTEYFEGETFDPAGMVVMAYYTDNTSKEAKDYGYAPKGELTVSDNIITVSYTEGDITCKAEQTISVSRIKTTEDEIITEDEDYFIWNLYTDSEPKDLKIGCVNINEAVTNSNSNSAAFYKASLSGNIISVTVTGDLKEAAKPANSLLEFKTKDGGIIEYALPVEYKKPELKLSKDSVIIKKDMETKILTTVLYKTAVGNTEPLDLSDASVKFGGKDVEIREGGEIAFTADQAEKGKISIVGKGWNASDPVLLKFSIKTVKKDVLTVDLGGAKYVLINKNAKDQSFYFPVYLNGQAAPELSLTDKAGSGLASYSDGILTIACPADMDNLKAKTYTIKLSNENVSTDIKIKVSNRDLAKSVNLKVQSRYDVVTRQKMVIVPVLKDIGGKITDVSVTDKDFSAALNEAGNIIVDYNGNALNAKKLSIGDLTFKLKISDVEEDVYVRIKNVKAKKTNVTVKAAKVTLTGETTGVTNLICSYKDASGNMHLIAPEKSEIIKANNVTADVTDDPTVINISDLTKKTGSVKLKLTFHGDVTKTVTIKAAK